MVGYRAKEASWIANVNAGLSNGLGHNRTSPYHHSIANHYWHNGRVRADANVVSNPGLTPQLAVAARRAADGKWVVDKHCSVRNKTIIADANEFTDESVGLNFATFTDNYTALNLNEWPNKSGISDSAVVNINGFDNRDVRTKLNVPNSSRPQGGTSHPAAPSSPFTLTGRARSNTETTLRA